MAARDKFHDAVKTGLIKDGWTITNDPFFIPFGGVNLYADLGAEKVIAAIKEKQKIAVEIKSFLGDSLTSEFHSALGQFMSYRLAISQKEPEREVYLAVPRDIYRTFFQLEFARLSVQTYGLKLIIYDPEQEEILQWIN